MTCTKCISGKWRYGEHGACVFDTLEECELAAATIEKNKKNKKCSCGWTPNTCKCKCRCGSNG